ncbi:nuclear transport factor 2 family protein [Actinomadura adrarensis]|uniref:Nuclear transport factor 2 family protein n=1 Tax=Actinomadura adrarensis TaxID=1819600 RepID=A0ABW3CNK2_9ACTN
MRNDVTEKVADEGVVRAFYAARSRRDMAAIRELLDPDVQWHEPGEEDYSGSHRGRNTVIGLLEDLLRVTEGTVKLEATGFLSTAEHVVAKIRWSAERGAAHVEGNEIAVYRIVDGRIAEAWFHVDGYDPQALSAVFSPRDE